MCHAITHEQILNASSNGVIATNLDGKIVFFNKQADIILDLKNKDILGLAVLDVLPLSWRLVMECLKSGEPKLGSQIFSKRVNLMVNVTPIRDAKTVQGVVCSFQKMQQFEHAAKKLESYKKLNQQLEAIFKSSSDGLWVCDSQGKVIKINKASAKLNGVKAEDVIGKSSHQMIQEGVIDRSAVLEVLATRRKVSIMQYLPKTKKYVLVTGAPAFDEKGNIFLVVLNERDLTRLNRMGKQLQQARMITERFKDELFQLRMLELKDQAVIAKDKNMKQVLGAALKLSRLEASNILILGESGTGKGLLAKMIHENSQRRKKPLIQINCAALPENLLEAELFGYEKGAFTGASDRGKAGLFELAHEGTLFLDEIGDLPISVQAKLLKYLDDHQILRLGGTKARKIDCKVIAATNSDLVNLVKKKIFREDLFYRLNTFTLQIPPLRKRPEDIFELLNHFLSRYNKAYNSQKRISSKGFEVLKSHDFPGNVRELKSLIKQAVIFSEKDALDDFFVENVPQNPQKTGSSLSQNKGDMDLNGQLQALERKLIKTAMMNCKSTREMANYLGVSQPTIVRKLKRHGIPYSSIHN